MSQASWVVAAALGCAAAIGCGMGQEQSPTSPSPGTQPPPAGANFSVSPIPVDTIARITPLGYLNEPFPNDHTYWLTCDVDFILMGSRPCRRERQQMRSPADATVVDLNPATDGFLVLEGPPGLRYTFGHVTPEAGLARGSRVTAGQVVARMFADHGFDFGLTNFGVNHVYANPQRYHDQYLHGQHPVEQFPEPLRSELMSRSNSMSSKLGRLAYDVEGTAQGAWFLEGTAPAGSLTFGNEHLVMWLGPYVEREELRVASIGRRWPGKDNHLMAVDSAAPSWDRITPASGVVVVKLWGIRADATPNLSFPQGTAVLLLLSSTRMRFEWLPTHAAVADFTPAAVLYER